MPDKIEMNLQLSLGETGSPKATLGWVGIVYHVWTEPRKCWELLRPIQLLSMRTNPFLDSSRSPHPHQISNIVLSIMCIIIMFLPQRMRVTCWPLPCVTQASLCREFGQCLLNEPITETLVYAQRNEFKRKPPKRPPGERQKISLTENKTFLRNPHFSFTKETP